VSTSTLRAQVLRLLRGGRRAQLPAQLATALRTILGEPVDSIMIIEHAWCVLLHGSAIATTRRQRIYLRGSAAQFFACPELLLHEYCHVVRQWQPGHLTRSRYLLECVRHGYWNNCYEVEARAFAVRHGTQLRALLGASPGPSLPS
jgi:hypothetical protein